VVAYNMDLETLDAGLSDMSEFAEGVRSRVRIPKNDQFSRADVVRAFANSFELIGGVPRLALWAHQNEGDFFKLYAKLLPSTQVVDLNVKVAHSLNELSTQDLERIVRGEITPEQVLKPAIETEYVTVPTSGG